MKQDEFLMWLFEKFNMPESRYADLTRIYGKALPENSDFEHLKSTVIKEWQTPTTLPTTNWLRYKACPQKHKERGFGAPCEAIKAAKEAKAYFEANFEACHDAMKECMAHYEAISGRKLRRRQGCF